MIASSLNVNASSSASGGTLVAFLSLIKIASGSIGD